MMIRTGCGHHFDTTARITEPNRAGRAGEIARLPARDPAAPGACLAALLRYGAGPLSASPTSASIAGLSMQRLPRQRRTAAAPG